MLATVILVTHYFVVALISLTIADATDMKTHKVDVLTGSMIG